MEAKKLRTLVGICMVCVVIGFVNANSTDTTATKQDSSNGPEILIAHDFPRPVMAPPGPPERYYPTKEIYDTETYDPREEHKYTKKLKKHKKEMVFYGCEGRPGSRGIEGPRGQPGIQGMPGKTGPMGLKGNKGKVGPQGPPGEQGKPGDVLIVKTNQIAFSSRLKSTKGAFGPYPKPKPLHFTNIITNIGYALSEHGAFTAPVAGVYVFSVNVLGGKIYGADIMLTMNGNHVMKGYGKAGHQTASINCILPLLKGDTVGVILEAGKEVDGSGLYSSFTGFLIIDSEIEYYYKSQDETKSKEPNLNNPPHVGPPPPGYDDGPPPGYEGPPPPGYEGGPPHADVPPHPGYKGPPPGYKGPPPPGYDVGPPPNYRLHDSVTETKDPPAAAPVGSDSAGK